MRMNVQKENVQEVQEDTARLCLHVSKYLRVCDMSVRIGPLLMRQYDVQYYPRNSCDMARRSRSRYVCEWKGD